jgi:hypothetical protein
MLNSCTHLSHEQHLPHIRTNHTFLFFFFLSPKKNTPPKWLLLSHPYFGQVWGWSPTLGKVGSWSPPGLLNVQSSTASGKTPFIWVFLVSLERSWSVDNENGLALAIWTSLTQVMGKRRAGSQIGSLTPDHKKSGIDLFPTSELRVRYVVGKISTRVTSLV